MALALVCHFPSQSRVFKTLSVPPAVLVVCPPVYPKSPNLTREKMQGLPPIKKSRRFRRLSPGIKEKSPEKLLLWLWMRRYSATVSSATIIRGRLPVAIFWHPYLGAFPQNLPSLSLIALLLSFPTNSELIETFPPPPHIDLIEVMGYNLCAVRSCATADGSLKREEHRSSRQSLTVLCLVGKREQSYRPQIRQEIKARITG